MTRWSSNSHQTGVVNRFYKVNLPNHRNSWLIRGKNMQILLFSDIKVVYIYHLKHLKDFMGKTALLDSDRIAFLL